MPNFPELPQESLQVMPSAGLAGTSPEALGAGIGTSLRTAGEAANRIYRIEQAKADQVAVMAKANAASEWKLKNLYDPKTGVLNQNHGIDAPKVTSEKIADYEATMSKLRSGLSSDAQVEQFDRMAEAESFQVKRTLYAYEHQQTTKYAADQNAAYVANTQTDAVLQAGDPAAVGLQLEKQRTAIIDQAVREGWPPEKVQEEVQGAASQTHLMVLRQLVSTGQDQQAQAWYDAHKQDFTAANADDAARLVQAGSRAGMARRYANAALEPDSTGELPSEGTAIATLERMGIKDPEVFDAALAHVQKMQTLKRQADTEYRNTLQVQAYNALDSGQDVPPEIMAELEKVGGKYEIELYRAKKAKGEADVTDFAVYEQLHSLAMSDDPAMREKFISPDFNIQAQYQGSLAKPELKEAIDLQTRLRKERNDNLTSAKTVNAETESRVLKEILPALGIDLSNKDDKADPEKLARAGRFRDRFRQAVLAEQGHEKGPIPFETMKKIAAGMVADVTIMRGERQFTALGDWLNQFDPFGPKPEVVYKQVTVPAFEAADGRVFSPDEIPATERTQIEEANRIAGIPTDAASIVRVYNRNKARNATAQ